MLGLPAPNPSSPLRRHEEELLEAFLEGWRLVPSDETLIRAARLIADGTRLITLGWSDLIDEQLARSARERLLRGGIQRFPEEVIVRIITLFHLAPRMTAWLIPRYLERRSVSGTVEGFEQFERDLDLFGRTVNLASRVSPQKVGFRKMRHKMCSPIWR